MIKVTDKFIAPSRGTVADVLAFWATNPPARPDDSLAIIRRVYDLCAASSVDFALAVSRIADETGALNGPSFFVSDIYRERLNIGGIGVTDGDDLGISFTDPIKAADAYMAHLFTYVMDDGYYDVLDVMPQDDPRYDATPKEWMGSVKTLNDLQGKWFTNPNGAINSAARGNRIFPNIPDQQSGGPTDVADLVFGKVPLPTVQVRDITNKPEGTGWDDLGQRHPYGVVLHRMLGTLRGTDSYFRQDGVGALTDYGVGVDGPDAKADDGVIMRWNDPNGRRAGWASGPVSSPYGDGLAFVNTFGINAVNRDLVSIEISGFQTTPLTTKSRAAIMGLMAYYADQKHVAWDKYPIGPDGFSVVYYHEEFTLGTGKRCPFDVVKDETAALIEGARGILKKYQTESETKPPKPPTYAPPDVPDWMAADLKAGFPVDHTHNGVQVFAALRKYEVTKTTKRRQNASTDSDVVGPPLKVRENFLGWYWSKSPDGKHTWVWTPFGTRVDAAALTPRVAIRKA